MYIIYEGNYLYETSISEVEIKKIPKRIKKLSYAERNHWKENYIYSELNPLYRRVASLLLFEIVSLNNNLKIVILQTLTHVGKALYCFLKNLHSVS